MSDRMMMDAHPSVPLAADEQRWIVDTLTAQARTHPLADHGFALIVSHSGKVRAGVELHGDADVIRRHDRLRRAIYTRAARSYAGLGAGWSRTIAIDLHARPSQP
jgi:hypothetical protein